MRAWIFLCFVRLWYNSFGRGGSASGSVLARGVAPGVQEGSSWHGWGCEGRLRGLGGHELYQPRPGGRQQRVRAVALGREKEHRWTSRALLVPSPSAQCEAGGPSAPWDSPWPCGMAVPWDSPPVLGTHTQSPHG